MFIFLCVFIVSVCHTDAAKPNIIFILADDLGWNDVGFHGSNQIPTPNIDALAVSGLMLHNYYVTPLCTPSRSALMTGRYPIHNGMQHTVIYGMEPRGLPLSEKILPQYLKELGYKTHLVGKWHLGHYKREYLPLNRGFDSHLGHWTGKIDLYDHTNHERDKLWGFDFRRGYEVAHDLFGQYATDVYTNEAVRIIKAHNASEPLFLMVSHSAVHSGNPSEPLRAPEKILDSFLNITNRQRQKYAGMISKVDESVGKVVKSLYDNGLLSNSVIVFSSDNGGPAEGFNDNAASNFPLRGIKNTLWEGGVRGAGLLWSPLLEKRSRLATQLTHIVDWLPTLYSAAGGNVSVFQGIDGINQWDALSKDIKTERNSIVHNIDDIYGMASITIDQWKIHKGTNYKGAWDNWYGPHGREGTYDADLVRNQLSGQSLRNLGFMPTFEKILELRAAATIQCNDSVPLIPCNPLAALCLYNIEQDPCELFNLADQEPEILQRMLNELDLVNQTVVPPSNKEFDPRGDPKYWGRVFTNFGDYEIPMTTLPTYDYNSNSL